MYRCAGGRRPTPPWVSTGSTRCFCAGWRARPCSRWSFSRSSSAGAARRQARSAGRCLSSVLFPTRNTEKKQTHKPWVFGLLLTDHTFYDLSLESEHAENEMKCCWFSNCFYSSWYFKSCVLCKISDFKGKASVFLSKNCWNKATTPVRIFQAFVLPC